MLVERVQKVEIGDISAIEISCECGATLTLALGGQYPSLSEECRCVSCRKPLWCDSNDTNFAQALIRATGPDSRNRFRMIVRSDGAA